MFLKDRKGKLNDFFKHCFENKIHITHELINYYFSDSLNRIIAELVAVRKYDNRRIVKISDMVLIKLMKEAHVKEIQIKEIIERNRTMDLICSLN